VYEPHDQIRKGVWLVSRCLSAVYKKSLVGQGYGLSSRGERLSKVPCTRAIGEEPWLKLETYLRSRWDSVGS
jgi:hypothetical protein